MTKEIELTKGKFALVDDGDYEMLMKWCWYFTSTGYAANKGGVDRGRIVYMHRYIVDCPEGMVVDHIDGDKLNNHRGNLRIVTASQNLMNTKRLRKGAKSVFKGVSAASTKGKWRAYIKAYGKYEHLGHFNTEEEAAIAYDAAALKYFGEYASLNFENNIKWKRGG